jgi:hypothetical protein
MPEAVRGTYRSCIFARLRRVFDWLKPVSWPRLRAIARITVGLVNRGGFQPVRRLTLSAREEKKKNEPATVPERGDPLVLGDTSQGIEDALVVCSLVYWLEAVRLHSYEREVCWVSDHRCDSSRGETGKGAFVDVYLVFLTLGAVVGGNTSDERVEES